jgi:transposase-like protein
LRVFLSFRVSYNQSILDAYLFLKEVRIRYGLKPIWTGDAVWYPEACRWARFEHRVYGQDWKNLTIERMNQALKDRLECFDDLFPRLKEECGRKHVTGWISVFRFFHNLVRTQEDRPEYQRFIEILSEALT